MPTDTPQKPPAPVVPLPSRSHGATAGTPQLPGPSARCWTRIAALEAQIREELLSEGLAVAGWSFDGHLLVAATTFDEARELAERWSCSSVTLCRIGDDGLCR